MKLSVLMSMHTDQKRIRRQNEIATMHATLVGLREKKQYYTEQIRSYHVYIDQSMAGLQKKRYARAKEVRLAAT